MFQNVHRSRLFRFSLERNRVHRQLPLDPGRDQHDPPHGLAVPNAGFRLVLRFGSGVGRRDVFGGLQRAVGKFHVRQERLQADIPPAGFRDGDNMGDARVHLNRWRVVHNNGADHSIHLRIMVISRKTRRLFFENASFPGRCVPIWCTSSCSRSC